MKKLMFLTLMIAAILVACQSNTAKTTDQAKETATDESHEHEHDASHEHSATHDEHEEMEMNQGPKNGTINDLISKYLALKNAFTQDNSKEAAKTGKEMVVLIASVNMESFTPEQKTAYNELIDDTKEHAEHIGENEGNLEHQREHFAMLSKDINDLITTFGTDQKLFQDFCPMFEDGKGAIWISESKDIKNPYYGKKMLSCGKMQKEL